MLVSVIANGTKLPARATAALIVALAAYSTPLTLSDAHAANSFMQRMILKRLDTNRDGAITLNEFGPLQARMFGKLDKNRDGALSKAEFAAPNGVKNDRRAAGFTHLDQDRNGRLSKAEFAAVAPRMFEQMDGNRDGRLTPQELLRARKRMGRTN